MKIPEFQNASVDGNKVTGYLLSEAHQNGRHKARFFKRFGFSAERPEALQEALKNHASNDYIKAEHTAFGVRYIIEALLESPDGRNPPVRSVWFSSTEGTSPRLVTAYPV